MMLLKRHETATVIKISGPDKLKIENIRCHSCSIPVTAQRIVYRRNSLQYETGFYSFGPADPNSAKRNGLVLNHMQNSRPIEQDIPCWHHKCLQLGVPFFPRILSEENRKT
jgi:hypothetical protein